MPPSKPRALMQFAMPVAAHEPDLGDDRSIAVERPLVRSFVARFVREAAAHVKAGGHAVVWDGERSARLVFRPPARGDMTDLGRWALLDLGLSRFRVPSGGALQGLAVARVPRDCLEIVRARAERDSVHPGATRWMTLDCLHCAACCTHNRVELTRRDLLRWRRAGRPELARQPLATVRSDGKRVLSLLRSGDCRHLHASPAGKSCDIYALRPDACREFPPGSEGCLFSREEELGLVDV